MIVIMMMTMCHLLKSSKLGRWNLPAVFRLLQLLQKVARSSDHDYDYEADRHIPAPYVPAESKASVDFPNHPTASVLFRHGKFWKKNHIKARLPI